MRDIKFAENLRYLRTSSNLTQEELAKQIGSSQKQISKWEIGLIEPNIYSLCMLADFFHVSIDFLVGREDI